MLSSGGTGAGRRCRPQARSVVRRFLYDTAVFVYALGRDHQYREPCRQIIDLARAGHLAGEASVELIQEFLHVRTQGMGIASARCVRPGLWHSFVDSIRSPRLSSAFRGRCSRRGPSCSRETPFMPRPL
jgi:hypothetical protein